MKLNTIRKLAILILCICLSFFIATSVLAATSGTYTPQTGVSVEVSGATNTYSGDNNSTVTVTATGSGGFFGLGASAKTATIKITNTSGSQAKINFTVTKTSVNSLKEDKGTLGDSSFSYTFDKDESVTLTLTTGKNSTENKVVLSGFKCEIVSANAAATVTFDSTKGSVSLGGTAMSSGGAATATNGLLTAVATPKQGYSFVGWRNPDTNDLLSTSTSTTLDIPQNINLEAVFVNSTSDTAWFKIDDKYLTSDLNYASSTLGTNIVLMNNGKLATGEYTIQSGDHLVIPYGSSDNGNSNNLPQMRNPNSSGTIKAYTNDPIYDRTGYDYANSNASYTSYVNSVFSNYVDQAEFSKGMHAYRTLTVPANTTIQVAGSLTVNGRVFVWGHHDTGTPAGTHGQIKLEAASSTIDVTGTLYCYGFITGAGTVNNSNSVYELFQIRDWRGATAGAAWNSDDTSNFLFSQYYIQNIECQYVVYAGAVSNVVASVSLKAGLLGNDYNLVQDTATFIGNSTSQGLFTLKAGKIVRTYVPSTERIEYSIESHGDTAAELELNSLAISVSVSGWGGQSVTFDTSDYTMPLQNNTTINIQSGKTTINSDIKLMPNVQVNVGENAELEIAKDAAVYIYDKNDWEIEKYTFWMSESLNIWGNGSSPTEIYDNTGTKRLTTRYSPTRGKPSGNPTELSAKITVDGTLTSYGNIFTSENTNSTTLDTSTGKDATKILNGSGTFINIPNSNSTNWTNPRLMETYQKDHTTWSGSTDYHIDINTVSVVARIKGITANSSSYNSLGIGTYHALSDNYWYNYKVTSDNAELITVTSTLAADSNANDNVVGYVSYYTVDDTNTQSAFTFTVADGYEVSTKTIVDEVETVTELTPDENGVYTLTNVSADTELVLIALCTHEGAVETPEVPATCETPGTKAYWTCQNEECGMIFYKAAEDEVEGIVEIEDLVAWLADENGGLIPDTGHSFAYVILESIDKTYNSYQYTCSCGAVGTFDDMMAEVGYQVQTLPEGLDFCAQGNLWDLLEPDEKYFYFGGTDFVPSWDDTYRKGDALSVTISVQEGMKIYANSFERSDINTSGYAGAFVTFYIQDENGDWIAQAWSREYVYKLVVSENKGYITVPEGAVYANISNYKGIQSPVLLINHIYEKGSTSNFTTPYSCATCNDVPSTMEEFQLLGGFTLQQLPENFGDGRNLWDSFIKDEVFYYVSSKNASPAWNGVRGTDDMQAITFAVTPGTQIYATSFQAEAGNGTTYVTNTTVRDGTWVTYFMNNGTTVQMQPSVTYSEYNSNGYITVPENAVGVQIAFYNNESVPVNQELKILSHSHSYDVGVVTIDPTCTEKGEKTYTCACGDSYTEEMPTINHSYNEDHVCTICGKQDIFDIYATNIAVADGLDLYFYVEKANLHVDEEYYAVVSKEFANGYEVNGTVVTQVTETIPYVEWEDHDEEFMRFCFSDISAKEMTDTITATVYFADGDDNKADIAASYTKEETIEAYVLRTLEAAEEDNPGVATKVKTALVDLVVYGASCQEHFNYNTSDLAEVGDTYSGYASTQMPEYENTPPSGTNFVAASVSAQNKLMYTFYFSGITAEQVEGLTATVTYTDWVDGSEIQLSVSGNEFYKYPNADWYGVDIKGLSMVNGYQNLKCVVTDTEGTIIAEGVDSIAGYVARAAEEDAQAVYTALISFVDSACTYFDSLRETLVG